VWPHFWPELRSKKANPTWEGVLDIAGIWCLQLGFGIGHAARQAVSGLNGDREAVPHCGDHARGALHLPRQHKAGKQGFFPRAQCIKTMPSELSSRLQVRKFPKHNACAALVVGPRLSLCQRLTAGLSTVLYGCFRVWHTRILISWLTNRPRFPAPTCSTAKTSKEPSARPSSKFHTS